jgi:GNAT superfamily N-acetyltransferase
MNILSVSSSEIARIREIDRTETINAKLTCILASDGNSIVLLKEEMDPPEEVPNWDDEGIRRRAEWWKREVDDGGTLFFAEDNGKLTGFAVLGAERAGKCAEMLALFVDKAYRTKGLGGKLVQRLEDWARERGIEKIYVQSVETTTSVGFYQSVGYRIACLMDASMMWLPGIETSIILVKRL